MIRYDVFMAGVENEKHQGIKRSQEDSLSGQSSGLRVLARITIREGEVSLEPTPGGIPVVNLITGERITPEDSAQTPRRKEKIPE